MGKVTKIIIIIVVLAVGYVVWEIKYDPQANFGFYNLRQLMKARFLGDNFKMGFWGKNCQIAYEYDSWGSSEFNRTRRFEDYLLKNIPCAEGGWRAVMVRKSGKTYEILVPFKKGADTDPEILKAAKVIARDLSINVFESQPVDIHMCDDFFNTNRVVVSQ